MKTITLTARPDLKPVTNSNNTFVGELVIPNVTNYRVGYKLIWIEYNGGESIIAVKRTDYASMVVDEQTEVVLHGDNFERINCEPYGNT